MLNQCLPSKVLESPFQTVAFVYFLWDSERSTVGFKYEKAKAPKDFPQKDHFILLAWANYFFTIEGEHLVYLRIDYHGLIVRNSKSQFRLMNGWLLEKIPEKSTVLEHSSNQPFESIDELVSLDKSLKGCGN
jgi:hypothetical protein